MTVPTIINVTPNTGPTGGRRVIKITGSGFQLPPSPPLTGKAPPVQPSVEVLFGDVRALETRVMATSLLHVVLPPSDFDLATGPGAVDVTVRNIDQSGVLVPGETVTRTDGFTYARPNLDTDETTESTIARITREIIVRLRREIVDNVELTVHVDYDDAPDGADITMLATMPGLVIVGPRIKENRFYSTNESRVAKDADGDTYVQRPPYTVDLRFTIIGVDDSASRTLNLQQEVIQFFQRNKMFRMARVPGGTEILEWEMEHEETPSWAGATNNSSIHVFNGSFVIRGVDIDEDDMRSVLAPELENVIPNASALAVPLPVILSGQAGVTVARPVGPGPDAAVGATSGPIFQIPPENE